MVSNSLGALGDSLACVGNVCQPGAGPVLRPGGLAQVFCKTGVQGAALFVRQAVIQYITNQTLLEGIAWIDPAHRAVHQIARQGPQVLVERNRIHAAGQQGLHFTGAELFTDHRRRPDDLAPDFRHLFHPAQDHFL